MYHPLTLPCKQERGDQEATVVCGLQPQVSFDICEMVLVKELHLADLTMFSLVSLLASSAGCDVDSRRCAFSQHLNRMHSTGCPHQDLLKVPGG